VEKDLQEYIMFYCQDVNKGGLWDKPGKGRDIYHTSYALAGLSLSQEAAGIINDTTMERVNPIFNVTAKAHARAAEWFK